MSFFSPPLIIFSNSINAYCEEINYENVHLNPNELKQLMFYPPGSTVTPEARGLENVKMDLHFEVKCAIARCYSFELLLNPNNQYKRFVDEQIKQGDKNILTEAVFKALAKEAQKLSETEKRIIKITTLLTISDEAKKILSDKGYDYPNDSEEFLSWLSEKAIKDQKLRALFPILKQLTDQEMMLLHKAYWPRTHLRHMMFTEGGIAMTSSLQEAIQNGSFSEKDFKIWKWRWLTNLMGFQIPAGKYFNQEILRLVNFWFERLAGLFSKSDQNLLDIYLMFRAEQAGLIEGQEENQIREAKFLAHIAAYFNQITILDPELGKAVKQGYRNYLENSPKENLAASYEQWRELKKAVTPTFVPAVLNTAYVVLNSQEAKQVIADAVQFTCGILNKLYHQLLLYPEQQISCMNLAEEDNLKPILKAWQADRQLDYQIEMNKSDFIIRPSKNKNAGLSSSL